MVVTRIHNLLKRPNLIILLADFGVEAYDEAGNYSFYCRCGISDADSYKRLVEAETYIIVDVALVMLIPTMIEKCVFVQ